MAWNVVIGGAAVDVLDEPGINLDDAIEERSTLSFTVRDDAGQTHYQKGQPVELWDEGGALVFAGTIDSATEFRPGPGPMLWHSIKVADYTSLSDKRVAHDTYTNMLAGDIVADLVNKYLKDEGVVGGNAFRKTSNTTEWGSGTLTGLGVTAQGDGALRLPSAGADAARTDTLNADFNRAGSANNGLSVYQDSLMLPSEPVLKFTAHGGASANFIYQNIGPAVAQAIASGDKLVFDEWVDSTSPEIGASVDANTSSAGKPNLRDGGNFDQNALNIHPSTSLAGYADGRWYHREFDLSAYAGSNITQWSLAFEGNVQGTYTAYFKGVKVLNSSGAVKYTVWDGGAAPSMGSTSTGGYDSPGVSVVSGYTSTYGTYDSAPLDAHGAGIVGSSLVSWTAQGEGANALVNVYTSADGGASWVRAATNGGPIPNLPKGASLSDVTALRYRVELSATGLTNPELGPWPQVDSVRLSVIAGVAMPGKLDVRDVNTTAADFGAGTLTNASTFADGDGALGLSQWQRDWNDGSIASQTLFGNTGRAQASKFRTFWLASAAGTDAKSRLDFVPSLTNFTAEWDAQVPSAGTIGVVYRTTSWRDANDTYAFLLDLASGDLHFGKGSNGATGSYTQGPSWTHGLAAGTWHRIRLVVNGSTHTAYVDGVQRLTWTDGTYGGAGQMALRVFGQTGGGFFDNFAVTSITSAYPMTGNRVETIALPAVTGGNSVIAWDADADANGNTLVIETSLDGGATYTACTNGGAIPGILGASLSGKSLRVRARFTVGSDITKPPQRVRGLAVWVSQAFNVSGQRVSPSLDLSQVGRAGNSAVLWTEDTPAGTSLAVETSLDGGATWQAVANNGDAIPGINLEGVPTIETFDADTSAAWTTSVPDGASLVWDVDNSRLTGSMPSTSSPRITALYTGLLMQNGSVEADVSQADALALMVRADAGAGAHDHYRLQVDSSDTNPQGGSLRLIRRVSNTDLTLATANNIGFLAGNVHRVRLAVDGSSVQGYFDGALLISVTDTSLPGAGNVGLFIGQPTNGTRTFSMYTFAARPQGDSLAGKSVQTRETLTSTDAAQTPLVYDETVSVRGADIQDGNLVLEATFNYVSVTECLAALAERADYWFEIDEDKRIKFKARQVEAATFPITSGENGILLDGTVKVSNGNPKYRNREYVIGGTDLTDVQTDYFKGDGTNRNFVVGYPLGLEPTVTLNGVAQTVGIKDIETGKQWYWNKGDVVLTQDDAAPALTSTDTLKVEYQGQFPSMSISEDTAAQIERQAVEGGGTGIVESVTEAPETTTHEGAIALANAKLKRYGVIGRTLSFDTHTPGLKPGQLASVYVPEHGFWGDQLLIESVGVTSEPGGQLRYAVSCVEGPVSGSWVKLFAELGGKSRLPIDRINLGQNAIVPIQAPVTSESWAWTEGTPTVKVNPAPVPSPTLYPSATLYPA